MAFADGGPARARRALAQLEHLLAEDERTLLERAAASPDGAPFSAIESLAALRDALLQRLVPQDLPGQRNGSGEPDVESGWPTWLG